MTRFVLRRLAELVLIVLVVSFVTFVLGSLLPGDPAVTILGAHHSPAEYAHLRHTLGLDQPLLQRYWHWLTHALAGHLGTSLLPPRAPVASEIGSALAVTLELCAMALVLALVMALVVAIVSARRPQGFVDRALSGFSSALISTPEFLAGILLILAFVVVWHGFPRLGWVPLTKDPVANLKHAFLPALALSLPEGAFFAQVVRNDLVETLREDYILAARATGIPPWRVLTSAALRPSLFSLVTVVGVNLGYLIGGTAVIETLFGVPGLGSLLVTAAGGSDVPVIEAVVLILALVYVVANSGIDLIYSALDPRVRRGTP
jgi:peptide/nickel transport system permease protein